MQAISIIITPASCEYDILDLPQHAKSPHPDSPPPTPRHTHIFGLQSRITSTPLSRSGQSVNQAVCKLEVRVNLPEAIALHHHLKVIFSAYFLAPTLQTPGSNIYNMRCMGLRDIYRCETIIRNKKTTWKPDATLDCRQRETCQRRGKTGLISSMSKHSQLLSEKLMQRGEKYNYVPTFAGGIKFQRRTLIKKKSILT